MEEILYKILLSTEAVMAISIIIVISFIVLDFLFTTDHAFIFLGIIICTILIGTHCMATETEKEKEKSKAEIEELEKAKANELTESTNILEYTIDNNSLQVVYTDGKLEVFDIDKYNVYIKKEIESNSIQYIDITYYEYKEEKVITGITIYTYINSNLLKENADVK